MYNLFRLVAWSVVITGLLSACSKKSKKPSSAEEVVPAIVSAPKEIDRKMLAVFGQLPKHFDSKTNPPTPAKLRLGKMLYYETRLSRSGTISCNSCHVLTNHGVDGERTSPGHAGARGDRNSPTTLNAAGHFRQFWDGREPDVEAQAKGPVLNPGEHGIKDAAEVEKILSAIPGYVDAFKAAFPEAGDKAVTFDNFAKAVGAFERKLVTRATWDDFLAGQDQAISMEAKIGARNFVEVGCTTCHSGALLGGTRYQKLGLVKPWPRGEDPGRKKVTGKDSDLHMFKVPSLRNISKTGPYFHDGQTESLDEAIKLMARHQLGVELKEAQVLTMVAFLRSLTGSVPSQWSEPPQLPADAPEPEIKAEDTSADAQAKPAKIKDMVPKAPPDKNDAPEPVPPEP